MKVFIGLVSIFIFLSGCSSGEMNKSEGVKLDESKNNTNSLQEKQNKELTRKVKDEIGVLDGQVYTQDGTAIGTLVLDIKLSDKDAKNLAEKYAKELKEEYKGKKVNVQAVRDGKNVANITKD